MSRLKEFSCMQCCLHRENLLTHAHKSCIVTTWATWKYTHFREKKWFSNIDWSLLHRVSNLQAQQFVYIWSKCLQRHPNVWNQDQIQQQKDMSELRRASFRPYQSNPFFFIQSLLSTHNIHVLFNNRVIYPVSHRYIFDEIMIVGGTGPCRSTISSWFIDGFIFAYLKTLRYP